MAQHNKGKHLAHLAASDDHSNGNSNHLEANMAALVLDEETTWYIDFATSSHHTRGNSQLTNVVTQPSTTTTIASGHRLLILVGKGKAILTEKKFLKKHCMYRLQLTILFLWANLPIQDTSLPLMQHHALSCTRKLLNYLLTLDFSALPTVFIGSTCLLILIYNNSPLRQ